jgi:hypothetical protein
LHHIEEDEVKCLLVPPYTSNELIEDEGAYRIAEIRFDMVADKACEV